MSELVKMQYCTDKERHEASLWRPRAKRTQRIPYCDQQELALVDSWKGRLNRGKPLGGRINYQKDRDTYLGRLPPHRLQPILPKKQWMMGKRGPYPGVCYGDPNRTPKKIEKDGDCAVEPRKEYDEAYDNMWTKYEVGDSRTGNDRLFMEQRKDWIERTLLTAPPPARLKGKACPPIPASEVDCCLWTSELQPNHKLITWYDQEKNRIDKLGLMSGLQSLKDFNVSKKQYNVLQDERNYYCEMLQRAGDEVFGIPDGTVWVHSNEIGDDKDKNRDKKREIYRNPTFLGKKKSENKCGAL